MHTLAFALKWDPELHGLVVVALAVVLLCGSVYLILGTNLGARVGFLVALSGLFGWMAIMGIVWTVYGIGLKGTPNAWKVETTVVGNVAPWFVLGHQPSQAPGCLAPVFPQFENHA